MTTWVTTPVDFTRVFSPVGLRLVDELTSQVPLGYVQAILDIRDANGNWRQTDIQAALTPSAGVTYPGLERHANISGLPVRRYRVRLIADFYIPHYLTTADGIEFDAYPYNDDNPPKVVTKTTIDAPLLPAPNYPFASHIPVLRGIVVDAKDNPVMNAYVTQGLTERALTDARGEYALALRSVQPKTKVEIDATDERTGRAGSISINFPADLNSSQKIPIS